MKFLKSRPIRHVGEKKPWRLASSSLRLFNDFNYLGANINCDELITCPEESYRLWCIVVCDLETSKMRRPWPALGRSATKKKANINSENKVDEKKSPRE
jgi:hypothetical protein